jgi:integrase
VGLCGFVVAFLGDLAILLAPVDTRNDVKNQWEKGVCMPIRAEVRKIERNDGRAARFGISIPVPGKSRKRLFFETAGERDREFFRLKRIAESQGREVFSVSAGDVQLLREVRELLPPGVDVREAVRFFLEHHRPVNAVVLSVATHGYLEQMAFRRLDPDHQRHAGRLLGRLKGSLGDVAVGSISAAMMQAFLLALPFAAVTVRDHQKHFRAFFRWCVGQGFCLRSPMAGGKLLEVAESEPGFMGVDEVRKLFLAGLEVDPLFVPALALSFFGGLRSSSIRRLKRDDLLFEERGIRMPGAVHKTGRRFFVQGFEDNLWSWLEAWRGLKALPVWPSSSWIKSRERMTKKAGVVYPHNGGRHSFCTYHVALHGSADRTATLLTHRGSVSMLYDHYRGNATRAEAVRYFGIKFET